ncbi:MAG TPA: acetylglutamate kinase [Firmicutes bacterium]|nr:acetylglutamate kinase [Bacillota bacterium]
MCESTAATAPDLDTLVARAGLLVESLPYIRRYWGKIVVIKYGGAAMIDDALKQAVITDIVLMRYVGMKPVLVHGGGPEITALMDRLGKKPLFVDGLRVTDRDTADIAGMVLAGKVNKDIVSRLNAAGGKAVGISGPDGGLIQARRKVHVVSSGPKEGEQADLGFVGEVTAIDPAVLYTLMEAGYVPVVAPIGVGAQGETLNINADSAAGELAAALGAQKLILLTDVPGILRDPKDPSTLMSTVRQGQVPALVHDGFVRGGMVPKVDACVRALQAGVPRAHIVDGRIPHALLLEIFTDQGVGTMVLPDQCCGGEG